MTQQDGQKTAEESKAGKKPYVAPALIHLGSVRELTAGAGGSVNGDGPFMKPGM